MSPRSVGLDLDGQWALPLPHRPFASVWNQNSCANILKLSLDWKPAQQGQRLMSTFSIMNIILFKESFNILYVWSKI